MQFQSLNREIYIFACNAVRVIQNIYKFKSFRAFYFTRYLVSFLKLQYSECNLKKCDFKKLKFRKSDFVMFGIAEKMLIKILEK